LPAEEGGAKRRLRAEPFADHFSQARQFYISQTEVEQRHIADAFVFELSKCEREDIRTRMVAGLRNVHQDLAQHVADGLGLQELPDASQPARPPIEDLPPSEALSILRNGPDSLAGRKIGVLICNGADAEILAALETAAEQEGVTVEFVAPTIGGFETSDGSRRPADEQIAGGPSVLYDVVLILPSEDGASELARMPAARVRDRRVRTRQVHRLRQPRNGTAGGDRPRRRQRRRDDRDRRRRGHRGIPVAMSRAALLGAADLTSVASVEYGSWVAASARRRRACAAASVLRGDTWPVARDRRHVKRGVPARQSARPRGDVLGELGLGHALLLRGGSYGRATLARGSDTERCAPAGCRWAGVSEACSMSASTWPLSAAHRPRTAAASLRCASAASAGPLLSKMASSGPAAGGAGLRRARTRHMFTQRGRLV
jgi:hypothetical protein